MVDFALAKEYGATGLTVDTNNATTEQLAVAIEKSKEMYLAVAFLLGSGRNPYGRLLEDLQKDYLQGYNKYPTTVTGAYGLLCNWK